METSKGIKLRDEKVAAGAANAWGKGAVTEQIQAATTTTIMTPPDLIAPNSGTAGNMTVTIPAGGNHVMISVLFIGNNSQSVTINGAQVGNSGTPSTWSSIEYDNPGQYVIAASTGGSAEYPYPYVQSLPVPGGQLNTTGVDITAYSDAHGNKAVIAVVDLHGLE